MRGPRRKHDFMTNRKVNKLNSCPKVPQEYNPYVHLNLRIEDFDDPMDYWKHQRDLINFRETVWSGCVDLAQINRESEIREYPLIDDETIELERFRRDLKQSRGLEAWIRAQMMAQIKPDPWACWRD